MSSVLSRWTLIVTSALLGVASGYAFTALTPFGSLIDPSASFGSYAVVVNSVVVASIAAGVTAAALLPRLAPRATTWLAGVALVVAVATTVVSEPNTSSHWAGSVAAGVLLACGASYRSTPSGRFAAAVGWMAAAAVGRSLDTLFVPPSDFGWTAYRPGDEPPTVGRVSITIGLAVAAAIALVLSEVASRWTDSPDAPTTGSWRVVAVAAVLPVLVSVISRTSTQGETNGWLWFTCAAALTVASIVAALTLPHRNGQSIAAALAVGASSLASVGVVFDYDSSYWLALPAVAIVVGALISLRRRSIYIPLLGLTAIAAVTLIDDRTEIGGLTGSVLRLATSLFVGYLIATASRQVHSSAVAIALPATLLLSLPYTVYSAGYDETTMSVTSTDPDQQWLAVTGLCMIVASIATIMVVRRRDVAVD